MCVVHQSHDVSMYCFNWDKFCCPVCWCEEHQNQDHQEITIVEGLKRVWGALVKSIRHLERRLREDKNAITISEKNLEDNENQMMLKLQKSKKHVIKKVEEEYQLKVNMLKEHMKRERKKLMNKT